MYPAISPRMHTGEEIIVTPAGGIAGNLVGFWQWAYSDLISNAERGALAEYIVACALDINQIPRISWGKYDLLTKEGVAVEVKTSGYLQTWGQKTLSRLVFGIQPTYGWDSKSNEYETEQKRQSDIYVFCVHKHKDQATVDPLQISQWDFYLMPTATLNEKFGNQKTASLSALIKAGAQMCEFHNLADKIRELMK